MMRVVDCSVGFSGVWVGNWGYADMRCVRTRRHAEHALSLGLLRLFLVSMHAWFHC
jgi:hypothetical protein